MSYLDKLAKVEALLQRAASDGERQAAELAKGRILTKISGTCSPPSFVGR
jgi:hypothetical protein